MPIPPSFNQDIVARVALAVTPNDSTDLTDYGSLYVGTGGDVSLIPAASLDNTPVLFKSVPSGTILPVLVKRVRTTATTASNIVLLR